MSRRYYTVERAARELDVTTGSVIAMCKSGCLPPVRHRFTRTHGDMALVQADAVDALALMSRVLEKARAA